MTPNEIATDVAEFKSVETGNITALSMNYTYSFGRLDDSNTWD